MMISRDSLLPKKFDTFSLIYFPNKRSWFSVKTLWKGFHKKVLTCSSEWNNTFKILKKFLWLVKKIVKWIISVETCNSVKSILSSSVSKSFSSCKIGTINGLHEGRGKKMIPYVTIFQRTESVYSDYTYIAIIYTVHVFWGSIWCSVSWISSVSERLTIEYNGLWLLLKRRTHAVH